jgi:hypothetical protein
LEQRALGKLKISMLRKVENYDELIVEG